MTIQNHKYKIKELQDKQIKLETILLEIARELNKIDFSQANQFVKIAYKLFSENKIREAIDVIDVNKLNQEIKEIEKRKKENVEARIVKGILLRLEYKFDKAIECYQNAIEIKPDAHNAFFNMGLAYDDKGDKDKMIECYQKAIEIKPDFHEAFLNMGSAYLNKGDKNKAIECYQKAIEIKPDYDKAWHSMGLAYSGKDDIDKAIDCYQKAIKIKPDAHEVWNSMGVAYNDKGYKDKAIDCYQKAIEIKPDAKEAYGHWGFTLIEFGVIENAEPILLKGINLGDSDMGYMNLGHIYFVKGYKEKAFETYKLSIINYVNKKDFFEGYNKDYQYLEQYGLDKNEYEKMRNKLIKFR